MAEGQPQRMVRIRTFREKTIYEVDDHGNPTKHLSTKLRQIGPSLYMDAAPDENPMPAPPPTHWPAIGEWKRKLRAVKEHGFDGEDN